MIDAQTLPASWEPLATADVERAVDGTLLEDIAADLAKVAKPCLPMELTMPKALVLAGCRLSRPRLDYDPEDPPPGERGRDLLRLKLDTANGMACNVYALTALESGEGKDIGGGVPHLGGDDYIGTGGSGEGLIEYLKPCGNGIITIAEFGQYLDPKGWRASVTAMLTEAFNQGFVKDVLTRNRGGVRDAPFCYPSIAANVQPAALREHGRTINLESGFLARFLISRPQVGKWRPRTGGCDFRVARSALDAYSKPCGTVAVPQDYLQDLFDEFHDRNAPARPYWKRLVNEYGPRFAVMLAVRPDGTLPPLTDDHWQRAATLIRWFYRMGAELLADLDISAAAHAREERLAKYAAWLKEHGTVKWSEFSRRWSRGTDELSRKSDLEELQARGVLKLDASERGTDIVYGGAAGGGNVRLPGGAYRLPDGTIAI